MRIKTALKYTHMRTLEDLRIFFVDSTYNYIITKPKLILTVAQQLNKSRDKLLGQRTVTLFRKPADQEDGGLMS